MFKLYPVNNTNVRTQTALPNMQFTRRVFSVAQIYNTKATSCSSCGGGRR